MTWVLMYTPLHGLQQYTHYLLTRKLEDLVYVLALTRRLKYESLEWRMLNVFTSLISCLTFFLYIQLMLIKYGPCF